MNLKAIILLLLIVNLSIAQSPSVWRNHGKDFLNSRHQDSNLLNKLTVDQLSLIRTYTWENLTSSFKPQGPVSGTPSIWGNTLYYSDFNGNVLAYDKLDGSNVYWEYVPNLLFTTSRPDAYSRSTPSLDGSYVFLGTTDATPIATGLFPGPTVIRMDKDTGLNELARALTSDSTQIITMSGTSFDDTYFVGLSTQQSLYALTIPNFQCCSAVGKFYKLDSDLNTLWSFDTISIDLPIGPNGYSGASVWGSSPVIVETKEIVYITTGQNHNLPQYVKDCLLANPNNTMVCWEEGNYADSIIALNYTTGELIWHYTTRVDAWNEACLDPQSPNYYNCPQPTGPDGDFGMDVMYIESQYEECQEICECAYEIIHDGMMRDTEDTKSILSGVDRILSMIGEFFTGSSESSEKEEEEDDDDDDKDINIFANTIHLNQFSSKDNKKNFDSSLFKKKSEISFSSSVGNKNCNYFPCYRENYDCTTCYPFTDAKPYTVISTRGLYSFDSIITGNVALTPSSNLYGVPPTIVNGVIDINNSPAMSAHQDMLTAYESISNCTCDTSIEGDFDMNGALLQPGVYCISGNAWLNTTLVLPSVNPGGLEYTFIIQGNLTFYEGASITIVGENLACNINWLADRIIGEQNSILFGTFFSRDDIVIYLSQVFGKLFTLSGPIITYETEINPCECRFIPVSPTPSTSPTPTSTSTSSSTSTSTSSSTSTATSTASSSMTPSRSSIPSPSSSSSLSPSPTSLPSSSPSRTIPPIPCDECPELGFDTLSYAIVAAKNPSIINSGLSVINGNTASFGPLIGFPPGIIVGSSDINNLSYNIARNEITLAYNKYVNCNCQSLGSATLSNSSITPGIYCYDILTFSDFILFDTLGDPNSVFVIKANKIIIDDFTAMSIRGDGILGCNVVIVSTSDITIGSPTVLTGTFIAQTDIHYLIPFLPVVTQNVLTGHLYAITGDVNLYNVLITLCNCPPDIPISITPTPSVSIVPSITPSPSLTPNPCRQCYPTSEYQSYGLFGSFVTIQQMSTSFITGNIATTPGSVLGFPPSTLTGVIESNNAQALAVKSSIQSTFDFYTSCPCDETFDGTQIFNNVTFTPKTYCFNGELNFFSLGIITIDITSNPNGVVVIRAPRINFGNGVTMNVIGGSPTYCNVFFIADSPTSGIIQINSGVNLFGTFISSVHISMAATLTSVRSTIRGHLFSLTGGVYLFNLDHQLCSCSSIPQSITPTPSITPTQTCTCTPTPTITPQRRCDCQCDLHGNTHVPRYSMVLAADKAGVAYGINADNGSELWKTVIGPGGTLGGSSWGGTNDGKRYAYYNIINNEHKEWRLTPSNEVTTSGGWVKIDIWTGAIIWSVRVPEDPLNPIQELWAAGPPTLVNDVLITTSVNGRLYVIDTMDGSILWNEHIANSIYGGASADNTNCIYVGSGYSSSFGLLEDDRVFQFCIGDPISYSVEV